MHDWSKFSPEEFWESVKYYNGKKSPIIVCKQKNGYSKAWLHHKGRNKHHTEYWYDTNAPEPTPIMPYEYVAEMLCDKMAAGIIYQGKKWTKEYELSYWLKEKDKVLVNPKIKDLVTDCMTQVAEKGINAVYTKKNFKELKRQLVDTGDAVLAECAVRDQIWGIGLSMGDPNRFERSKWKGNNLLGYALMLVREQL